MHYFFDYVPFIKKRLKPKTVSKAKHQPYRRENMHKLNKLVHESNAAGDGNIVKVQSRFFGRGDIKKEWDPDTGIRKKLSVTDSEGNIVREIEFDSQGDMHSQKIVNNKKKK